MKYTYDEFKKLVPGAYPIEELAEKLSAIGFETDVIDGQLETSLTANRRADCTNLQMVAFDFAAIYDLQMTEKPEIKQGQVIPVTLEHVNKILGTKFTEKEYQQIERLGFIVEPAIVSAPEFRKDLDTAADIAEEVIRLNGYNKLNVEMISKQVVANPDIYQKEFAIKTSLANLGINEALTTTFTSTGSVELKNPLNQTEKFMRPTLEDGLLQVLAKNPYLKKAAFFEIGTIFSGDLETTKIGLIIAGFKNTDDWQKNISKALGINVIFKPADTDKISQYDAKQGKINFVEIDFNACQIKQVGNVIKFPLGKMKLISKFPPLVRDFTVIAKEKSALEMITECQEKVPEILLGEIIDEYTNPETHQTATTIRLILQKMSGSFTDDEISVITKKLSDLLKIN